MENLNNTTKKAGRPRKYMSDDARKEGANALRRQRRRRAAVDALEKTDQSQLQFVHQDPSQGHRRIVELGLASFLYSHTANVLVDPLLQDFGPEIRCYIKHFSAAVCRSLVSYDAESRNPYRGLVAQVGQSPLLLNIIVAISAMELRNLTAASVTFTTNKEADTTLLLADRSDPHLDGISAKHEQYSLSAKSKALHLLRARLQQDDLQTDFALACIVLLISTELISSGKEDWRIHVDGAKNLIPFVSSLPSLNTSRNQSLLDLAVADCLTYDVLGTMLRPCSSNSGISSADTSTFFSRTEANSYISCPAVLLQVILSISKISQCGSTSCQTIPGARLASATEEATRLLGEAQELDVYTWAAKIEEETPANTADRCHVALAHRAATLLYINRAASYAHLLSQDAINRQVETIISCLSCVTPTSELLKGSSWPAFIAGAEATESRQIVWVMCHLRNLWKALPWGYLKTAAELLRRIWDARAVCTATGKFRSWLHRLHDLGFEWIIA